jgi:hypothetical protein
MGVGKVPLAATDTPLAGVGLDPEILGSSPRVTLHVPVAEDTRKSSAIPSATVRTEEEIRSGPIPPCPLLEVSARRTLIGIEFPLLPYIASGRDGHVQVPRRR